MDRRTFINGVTAAGILAAVPAMAAEPAHDPRNVVWIANGNGWRQVYSLLDVKKGDIFCMSWPVPEKALSDGFLAFHDKRNAVDAIYSESFCSGGPSVYPPYPYCNRCKDWRIVPEDETRDEYPLLRICNPCIADPTRAARKYEAYRKYFAMHPLPDNRRLRIWDQLD